MSWLAALAIGCLGVEDAARSELAALGKQLSEATSYTFTHKAVVNGKDEAAEPEDPDVPARGGGPRDVWTVQYERDKPIRFRKAFVEFYRLGHRYVALGKDDRWTPIELPPRIEGEPASKERLRGFERMAFEIDRTPLPHELLATVDAMVEKVERKEVEGSVEYVATLTKKAAREFLTANRGGRTGSARKRDVPPAEAGADGQSDDGDGAAAGEDAAAAPPELVGTLHVVTAKDGEVTRVQLIEIDVVSRTATGERSLRREYALSAFGTTTLRIPEPALEILGRT